MTNTFESKIHIIACGVLATDLKSLAERLNEKISMDFLPGGLHENPRELRTKLQDAIDAASKPADRNLPRRIVLGYGVCGRGTVGVHARAVPLVIPRVHDCISLFLGSNKRYREEFKSHPGTYYVSGGWYNEKVQPPSQVQEGKLEENLSNGTDLAYLAEEYGEENAEMILDFLSSWQRNYERAVFIDTGADGREKYADYAQTMAKQFHWEYKEIQGDLGLLEKAIENPESCEDILVVPPGYATVYDPLSRGLQAVPGRDNYMDEMLPGPDGSYPVSRDIPAPVRIGLGLDAGGTYTDAVVYDFETDSVLEKAKSLTTHWDFTIGIDRVLRLISPEKLKKVGLVAVSTTLATNAIVEDRGQRVGLLVMPPYGLWEEDDIDHHPTAIVPGRLEISGDEIEPVNADRIKSTADRMLQMGVGAFAVSGYASTMNPEHELQVKNILQKHTGLSVSCGHRLSEMLNFRTRAITAVLNARIIPQLEQFLDEAKRTLRESGISAPMMAVKGDGSLMSTDIARQKPVETILSGPAASVAGASYLTGERDAFVVDMGGTTTDTAALENGQVRVSDSGTRVGDWQTHIRALHMRTSGLGGDSIIAIQKRHISIGPRRVAPISWLGGEHEGVSLALDYIEQKRDELLESTRSADILFLTGRESGSGLSFQEKKIFEKLENRPKSVVELAEELGTSYWSLLRSGNLEARGAVQRSGLTPTDLLHCRGDFQKWHSGVAKRFCRIMAGVIQMPPEEFQETVLEKVARVLALELLKKNFDSEVDPDIMDECPVCQEIVRHMLHRNPAESIVELNLKDPLIGVGAPVHHFLPRAAEYLGTEAIVPRHADVANAIGAITSHVVVSHHLRIQPDESGGFSVDGLPGTPTFEMFQDANDYAVRELREIVRKKARGAGTSAFEVEVQSDDRVSKASDGTEIFLERRLQGVIMGAPEARKEYTSE
ncbi:MAG: DUF1638 domain-containing protein [Planctomycetes bacterium]|nr:DUF1638 domain-containing protein [Planctomycetota bacterium]